MGLLALRYPSVRSRCNIAESSRTHHSLWKYVLVHSATSTLDFPRFLPRAAGQVPPIFAEIDWSTPSVWQQTVDRLNNTGCRFAELPLWSDVDDLADLVRIADELKQLSVADSTWTSLSSEVQTALAEAS